MDDEKETKKSKQPKTVSRMVCILLVVLSLLVGGGAGYYIGSEVTAKDNEDQLNQKISQLEKDLQQAKSAVGDEVAEGQQSVSELQAENAKLKNTVSQQNQKIEDLEQQLKDAQDANNNTPTPPPSQN